MRLDWRGKRSSVVRASPVTGSVPFSSMYASIRRFSYIVPEGHLS
jgi:hypothetical protein